jgi:hypothetical protein
VTARSTISHAAALALCVLALAIAGCKLPPRVLGHKPSQTAFDSLAVSYELGSPSLAVLSSVLNEEVRLTPDEATNTELVSADSPNMATWSGATLQLQYPHPAGLEDHVRATLRLSRGLAAESDDCGMCRPDDEVWSLDIPRAELETVLASLTRNGYFRSEQLPAVATQLTIVKDGHTTARPWAFEPHLDQIIVRVYREGWLDQLVPCAKKTQVAAAPTPQ